MPTIAMPSNSALQRRTTRRRRSSSVTVRSSSRSASSTSISIQHDTLRHRNASPPHNIPSWRHSKRSQSELAGLRFLVLSHIQSLERKLEKLDDASSFSTPQRLRSPSPEPSSPGTTITTNRSSRSSSVEPITITARSRSSSTDSWKNELGLPTWDSEFDFSAVDDLRTWVQESLDQLAHLRDEVSSRLPDFDEIRAHFPDLDFDFDFDLSTKGDELLDEFRARLTRMEGNLKGVGSRIGEMGYEYLPTLSDHLSSLHARLKVRTRDFEDRGSAVLREFIDALMYSDEGSAIERKRVVDEVERTVIEVQRALDLSRSGKQLIGYHELPHKWRNNEHVVSGYRFIPLTSWPALFLSTFQLHNETANIHTHLLPLLVLGTLFGSQAYDSYLSATHLHHLPTSIFSLFAILCLFTSVGWHIFAGCSSPKFMETAARVDYLGIGWLISASIASLVYYAFSCRPIPFTIYITMTILAGLAGSVLPFMEWFNERKHKKWRIVFFLSLSLTGFIPVLHLYALHGSRHALGYIAPIVPSLASYVFGLCFYAFHFPECLWADGPEEHPLLSNHREERHPSPIPPLHPHDLPRRPRWTDWIGGGSHAIWHISIVVAIWLHRSAIPTLALGLGGERCDVWNGRMSL